MSAAPLEEATLLRRYKRFLADVRFPDGRETTAHCTNTGRMTGCCDPGSKVLVTLSDNPDRKLAYTLCMVKVGRAWVSVDTLTPNRVVAAALRRRRIPELAMYDRVRTEVRYGTDGRSRIDVLLEDEAGRHPPCYVEVKNVTLRGPPGPAALPGDNGGRRTGTGRRTRSPQEHALDRTALFPDAVSERGAKHLDELAHEVRRGHRAVLLPFVARADCDQFDAAWEVDPHWARRLHAAAEAGVEVMPWRARVGKHGVRLDRPLPWSARPAPSDPHV